MRWNGSFWTTRPDCEVNEAGRPEGISRGRGAEYARFEGEESFWEPLRRGVVRVKGIEPSPQAWEAHILPLNYTRNGDGSKGFGPIGQLNSLFPACRRVFIEITDRIYPIYLMVGVKKTCRSQGVGVETGP